MTNFVQMKEQFNIEADSYAASYKLDIRGRHNGEWDAFRHAYVSGRFTQAGYENTAQILGLGNEIFSKNQLAEREMDLWNNAKGRDFGRQTTTPDQLAERVYRAIQNNELILGIGNRPKANPAEQYDIKDKPIIHNRQQGAEIVSPQQKTFVEIAQSHPSWPKLNDAEQKLALHIAQIKDADAEKTAVVTTSEPEPATQANNNELNERGLNKRVLAEAQAESAARSSQSQGHTV
jgi:hypothetical protein